MWIKWFLKVSGKIELDIIQMNDLDCFRSNYEIIIVFLTIRNELAF